MQLQTTFGLEIEIYVANFRCRVQAMEAKRLEKWRIQIQIYTQYCPLPIPVLEDLWDH